MRENELLKSIFARSETLASAYPGVLVGPGDDCAVVRTPAGERMLLKVDQVVEGRHFTPQTPLDLVARKAVARAVSDIGAMGGTPLYLLAGAALPRTWTTSRADELCAALFKWSREFGCAIVGGDTSTHASDAAPLTLSVSIIGAPHPTRGPVLRSGAQAGDDLYVTGSVGGSFLPEAHAEFAFPGGGRHLTFTPRVREARWLCDVLANDLHAMMDTSDGLGMDASRLAGRSGVRIEIDERAVPLTQGQTDVIHAMSAGEDYELLFCVRGGVNVPVRVPDAGTPITRIGRVAGGSGCVMLRTDGTRVDAGLFGWEHQ